jgi:hypothetical protein
MEEFLASCKAKPVNSVEIERKRLMFDAKPKIAAHAVSGTASTLVHSFRAYLTAP